LLLAGSKRRAFARRFSFDVNCEPIRVPILPVDGMRAVQTVQISDGLCARG
jgi:hypothetical protein